MKIGTKIIATNSEHATSVPNGSIMTVTHVFGAGHVDATVDGGNGFEWYMHEGTFEEYTKGNTMKIGTKIIATNSDYKTNVPNGTIMTVARVFSNGHVDAIIEGGDGFEWFMHEGTFEEYTPLPYGHVTLPDGRTVDLTANRVRCDLMDPDELQAMKDHGGHWEWWDGGWFVLDKPAFRDYGTYRVAPKPVVRTEVMYAHVGQHSVFIDDTMSDPTHRLTLTIKDGDIIDTKTENDDGMATD